ncbi:MAG: glycosyltransferase [Candidatus Altiarchaeota archaeon]|nr:glycosyltransferase [Candidatus Altiarchaeota archaeon]
MKIKVLILTTTFPRWRGDSTAGFVFDLSKQLSREGVEVVVLAPHHPGAEFKEEIEGFKVYRFPYFWPNRYERLCYGGGILPNFRGSILAKIQAPFLLISELFYALKLIREEEVDVINSHWIVPSGFIASVFRKHYNIPHLMTVHAAGLFALKNIIFGRDMARFVVNNADKIITDGSYVKDALEDFVGFHINADTSAMGVNLKKFVVQEDKEVLREKLSIHSKNVVLYVGRLVHKKGVEYLIDAMETVVQVMDSIQLIIIGGGELEEKLRGKVERLGMGNVICFAGRVDHDRIAEYYAVSDVIVVPSIIDRHGETEGMPAVVLEAMACGKPLIASDVSGITDIVIDGYNGFIIRSRDSKDLAKKIVKAFRCEGINEIRENALKTAEEYEWGVISKRYVEAMEDMIKS